jgi:hypothetical protein
MKGTAGFELRVVLFIMRGGDKQSLTYHKTLLFTPAREQKKNAANCDTFFHVFSGPSHREAPS